MRSMGRNCTQGLDWRAKTGPRVHLPSPKRPQTLLRFVPLVQRLEDPAGQAVGAEIHRFNIERSIRRQPSPAQLAVKASARRSREISPVGATVPIKSCRAANRTLPGLAVPDVPEDTLCAWTSSCCESSVDAERALSASFPPCRFLRLPTSLRSPV